MALGTMNRFLFITIFLWVANFSAMAQAYKVSGHVFLHGQPFSFASIKNAHKRKVSSEIRKKNGISAQKSQYY